MYNVSDNYKELIKQPVRNTGISGTITLRTGVSCAITDDNVDGGSLSIVRKLNGRGDFRTGGVYSAELSIGVRGFAGKASDLDGARIALEFRLYSGNDRATYESVPLGVFYADGSTIRRCRDLVTLRADDAMMLFDVPVPQELSGTFCELATAACTACGVPFGMAQAAFEALPNSSISANVSTSRVQTWRDLLMYIGQATASFARINRSGMLEFVAMTAQTTDGGVVIPVREIAANVRFSTEFSDDTVRVGRVFMQRGGRPLGSTRAVAGGSAGLMQLELPENPLFVALSDDEVKAALDAQFSKLYLCINRAFSTDFNGDPSLDVGDYVRLRGGAIDTERGYATGMITSQTWRYRGAHTLKCTLPSSFAVISGEAPAQAAAIAADFAARSGAEGDETIRVAPKSQTEKEIDELRARLNDAAFPPAPIMYTFKQFTNVDPTAGGGFEFKSKDGTTQFALSENGIQLFRKNAANGYRAYIGADTYLTAYVEDSKRYNSVDVLLSPNEFSVGGGKVRPSGVGGVNQYHLYASSGILHGEAHDDDGNLKAQINIASNLVINYGSTYRIYLSEGQLEITGSGENAMSLLLTANGLYANGKKVLTEE